MSTELRVLRHGTVYAGGPDPVGCPECLVTNTANPSIRAMKGKVFLQYYCSNCGAIYGHRTNMAEGPSTST